MNLFFLMIIVVAGTALLVFLLAKVGIFFTEILPDMVGEAWGAVLGVVGTILLVAALLTGVVWFVEKLPTTEQKCVAIDEGHPVKCEIVEVESED